MDNKAIAGILYETADLLEIDGQDSFRIRSYRNAASAIEGYPERVDDILANPERKVTEIPGVGKGLASVLEELSKRGSFEKRDALLAQFPPTLLVTSTRGMEYSSAINSHNALVRAGVDAELHVWDGLPHAFWYNSDLPESREVYDVIARFFDLHFGK